MRTRDALRAARKHGKAYGLNAAAWAEPGTESSRGAYERLLKGIEDGDPMILDQYRTPNLSGEYADDPTPQSLAADIGLEPEHQPDLFDEACTAWERAASDAFWGALERHCRRMLS